MIVKQTFDMLRRLASTATVQSSRPMADLIADRLRQACTAPTLLAVAEQLMDGLGSQAGYVGGRLTSDFVRAACTSDAHRMLLWLRAHPHIAAMIIGLRDDADYAEAIASITLPDVEMSQGSLPAAPDWPIRITATCLAPLAHGADRKAGNATLFRRMQVISSTGAVLELPYYSGNAVRGQMRDLLADHMLRALGLTPNRSRPPLALWFFHALYAGGVLEEGGGDANKAVGKLLGNHGAIRADGIHAWRDMLPCLSLLGCAIGNRVISGRLMMGDLRPACKELGTGQHEASSLLEWIYLTRREDHESHVEHHGMIATTECLRAGVVLHGGCRLDGHANELEASALAVGLRLLAERGFLGAENRRGLGRVSLQIDGSADEGPYLEFLSSRRSEILDFLAHLGATDTSGNDAILAARKAKASKAKPAKDEVKDEADALPEADINSLFGELGDAHARD
ncbi:MAG: hypothetical protein N2690_08375 [Rhodocyclaceae bacterium]|nr:hypothetical protein [Rhodocyclaceae bacterium]